MHYEEEEDEEDIMFKQLHLPLSRLYHYYFMLSSSLKDLDQSTPSLSIDYVDGSKFHGSSVTAATRTGKFKRKPKLNYSYFHSFKGDF